MVNMRMICEIKKISQGILAVNSTRNVMFLTVLRTIMMTRYEQ